MTSPLQGQFTQEQLQSQPFHFAATLEAQDVQRAPEATVQQVCSFYMRTGTCAYGARCKFYHPHPSEVPPPVLNSRGYPIRTQGEPDCAHFLKKGWCAFGMTCKFNHPEIVSGPNLAIAAAQPASMLVTSAPVQLQNPVVYTGSGGQTYVQAGPISQPSGPTVYYVPASTGTYASPMGQQYSVHDAQKPAGLVLAQTAQDSAQPIYATTASGPSSRAVYTTAPSAPLYSTATQYIEQPGVQIVGAQPGRREQGVSGLISQGVGGAALGPMRQGGVDSGAGSGVSYEIVQASSLPGQYIQRQAGGLPGNFFTQPGGAGAARQTYLAEQSGVRRLVLSDRPGESSSVLSQEGLHKTSGAGQQPGMMLLGQGPASGGLLPGSIHPTGSYGSVRNTNTSTATASGVSGAGGSARGEGGEGGQGSTAGDAASQERLVQHLQLLRLQQQQQTLNQPQSPSH